MPDGQLQDVVHYLRRVVAPGGTSGVSDAELLQRFVRQRDEAAFELLVWRHGKMVLGVCRRLLRHEQEAEDAFQAAFLALARRAGALGPRESVGGWLYRVASHIALRARGSASRRTAREQAQPARRDRVVDPAEEAARRELRQVIDEEVNRLPAKYRVPFVLCHLGGRSNAEAARELGCPVGTLESWLARARRRLRGGLARRGVAVPAGLFAAGLGTLAAPPEVSATLAGHTAQAVRLVTTGQATVGLISARATAWAEGVLRTMYVTKLKIAAAVLLSVGLASVGVGGLTYGPLAAEQPGTEKGVASAPERQEKDRIDGLIRQLGSERFQEREKAATALDKIGSPALPALRDAAKNADPEVKRRAAELASKIEHRQQSADILAAKRVHLVYKNTPVSEAVADFQKKSGYAISLHDPEGKLKERKITLDTGEATFWHAFDLFCEKAGLVEATMQDVIQRGGPIGVPGGPVPPPQPIGKPVIQPLPAQPAPGALPAQPPKPAARGQALADPTVAPAAAPVPVAPPVVKPLPPQVAPPIGVAPGAPVILPAPVPGGIPNMPYMPGQQLVLKDAKPQKLPTDDRSAVRVRALPKADVFGTAPESEILLALEVTFEPKLQWQGMQSIRITKALDDQGQKLTQITPQNPRGPGGFPGGAPGGIGGRGLPGAAPPVAIRPGIIAQPMPWWGSMNQQMPVHLKKGEKAAKSLKELTGVISAFVLSEAKPIITAKLAKADGKTFKGAEGGSIKILEVKKDDKQTTIRFEFEQPPNIIPETAPVNGLPPVNGPVPRLPGAKILPAPAQPPARGGAPAPAQAPAAGPANAFQVQVGQAPAVAVQIQGGGIAVAPGAIVRPVVVSPFNGITVQDGKGNALRAQITQEFVQRVLPGGGVGVTITYTFLCKPGEDQGQPAKVVYSGRKRVAVDIPFTLKDVPLP